MNARIFWVREMKCMCSQTRSWFILSSERVFLGGWNGVWTHVNSKGKNPLYRKMSPEEDRTRDAVDSEPKHYQRAIPAAYVTCMTPPAIIPTVKQESNAGLLFYYTTILFLVWMFEQYQHNIHVFRKVIKNTWFYFIMIRHDLFEKLNLAFLFTDPIISNKGQGSQLLLVSNERPIALITMESDKETSSNSLCSVQI